MFFERELAQQKFPEELNIVQTSEWIAWDLFLIRIFNSVALQNSNCATQF